jgi:hypothetical protein
MRPIAWVGVLLLVLGIVGFAFGGFSFTRHKKVVDAGPLQISADEQHSVPITPIVAGLAVVGGLVLIGVGATRRT